MREIVPSTFKTPSILLRNCHAAVAILLLAGFGGSCRAGALQEQPSDTKVQLIPLDSKPLAEKANGSAAPATPKPSQPDVSKEAIVWDKYSTRIREESDGTGTRENIARMRILADAGVKEMAVLSFTYTAANQQVDIGYVRVVKPDGSIVVTPEYNVQDLPADVTRSAPMYSDIHQKHVAVKGLGVGDILEYKVTFRTVKPEVPGQFWLDYSFEKNLIVLDEQLDLDLPADKQVTVTRAELQPTITQSDGRRLYHWASANLARPDPDAPPKSVKHWKPSVQITTFRSWEQVGAWYRSLERDSMQVTPAIQAKAAALTKGLTKDEDKLQAIFHDVALHIHYVGLDFGIGRYQPHPADDVLSNEYGDCKDKHTLLAALLKAVGIEAWPVLISSNHELDAATPSPGQFDHVITIVPMTGKLVWMDSTAEVAPVGVLFGGLRDKQALAVPPSKAAYLERSEALLPFQQSVRFESVGKLSDEGVYTAHMVHSYHGDAEMIFRAAFRQVPESQWKELLQRVSSSAGFAGEVKSPEVSAVDQIGQPMRFSYDYKREKYGDWANHSISPALPPFGIELWPGVVEKKPADEPELGSPAEVVYTSSIEVPKNWAFYPPPPVDLKEDWAEYHSTYSFKDGVFLAERRLLLKKEKVPLNQWESYQNFRRKMQEDGNRMSVLQPPEVAQDWQKKWSQSAMPRFAPGGRQLTDDELKGDAAAILDPLLAATEILLADPPASKENLTKALDLSRKAVDAVEAKTRTFSAEDPNGLYWTRQLAYAWSVLGWAAMENKDFVTAESYLGPAWRLNQDQICGNHLGQLLEARGEKPKAARQYELAHIAGNGIAMAGFSFSNRDNLNNLISASYKTITGRSLDTVTPLKSGSYNGSLKLELDQLIEIRPLTRTKEINGQGLFVLAMEANKPNRIHLLQGDGNIAKVEPVLRARDFRSVMVAGSKALLMREVRVVCTEYAGCDAFILPAGDVRMPGQPVVLRKLPNNPPQGTKPVRIELQP